MSTKTYPNYSNQFINKTIAFASHQACVLTLTRHVMGRISKRYYVNKTGDVLAKGARSNTINLQVV